MSISFFSIIFGCFEIIFIGLRQEVSKKKFMRVYCTYLEAQYFYQTIKATVKVYVFSFPQNVNGLHICSFGNYNI